MKIKQKVEAMAVKSIKDSKTSTQFTQQVNMQDVKAGTYVVEIVFSDGTRLNVSFSAGNSRVSAAMPQ